MNSFKEKCANWWDGLPQRDQKILIFSAPVILLMMVYLLVFQPIQARYTEMRAKNEELSMGLIWLYQSAPLVERMSNQCSRVRLIEQGNDDLQVFAKSIGRRAGAVPELRSINANDLVASFSGASGNRILALIQSYVCHGFVVSELELVRPIETSSDVNLSLKLSPSRILAGG